jgi:hypothetical protein
MPLDPKKLEKLVDLAGGMMRARCPACAETGQDKKGEHLRVYPDGRFGCCVHPKDREHRRKIFALAGERSRQGIKVRVASGKSGGVIQTGILGRLGRLFPTPAQDPATRDARDGVGEVQPRSVANESSGTPGTGSANSKQESAWDGLLPLGEKGESGTPGTGLRYPRVYPEKSPSEEGVLVSTYKEFRGGVPGVPEQAGAEQPPEAAGKQGRMPYFTADGTLSIPFDSPERFHWWKGGQSVKETIAEVRSWTGKN